LKPGQPFAPQLQLPGAVLATTPAGPTALDVGAMAKVRWQAYPAKADGTPDYANPMPQRQATLVGPVHSRTPTFLFRPRILGDADPATATPAFVVAHLEAMADGLAVRHDIPIPVDLEPMATREVYGQLGRLFKVQVSAPAVPAGGILRASILPRGAEETEFVVKTASLQGKPILEVTGSVGLDGAMTALNAIAGRSAAPGAFALHDVATSIAILNDPAERVAATLAMLGEPIDRLAGVMALLSEPTDRVAATLAMLSEPVDRVASALALASLPVDKIADVAAVLLIPLDRIAGIIGLLSEPFEEVARALHLLGYPAEKVAQALAMLVEPVAGAVSVVSAFIGKGSGFDVDAGDLTRQATPVLGGASRLGDTAGTVGALLDTSDLRRRIASILASTDVKGQVRAMMQAPGFQERTRAILDDRGLPERLAAVLDNKDSMRRLRPLQQTGQGSDRGAAVLAGKGRLERMQAQAARDGVARGVQLPINVQVKNADFTKHLVRREDEDPVYKLTPRARQLPEVPGLVDEMQVADRLPDGVAAFEAGPLRLPFSIKGATWQLFRSPGERDELPASRYRFAEGTAGRNLVRSLQLGVPEADTVLRLVVKLQFGFDPNQVAAEGLPPLPDSWVALPDVPLRWLGADVLDLVAQQITLSAPATVPPGGPVPASLACPLFAQADPAATEVGGTATLGEGVPVPFKITNVQWRLLDTTGQERQRDAGRTGFAALAARLDAGLPSTDETCVLEASFRLQAGDGGLVPTTQGDAPLTLRTALRIEGVDVLGLLLSQISLDAPATVPAGATATLGVLSPLLPDGLPAGGATVRLAIAGGPGLPVQLADPVWEVKDEAGQAANLPVLPPQDTTRTVALSFEARPTGLPPTRVRLGPVRIRFLGLDLEAALRRQLAIGCPARLAPLAPLAVRLDGAVLEDKAIPLGVGVPALPIALAGVQWSLKRRDGSAAPGQALPSQAPQEQSYGMPLLAEDTALALEAQVRLQAGGFGPIPVREVSLTLQAAVTVAGLDVGKALGDALHIQAPASVAPGKPVVARLESHLFQATDGATGLLPVPDGPGLPFEVRRVDWTLVPSSGQALAATGAGPTVRQATLGSLLPEASTEAIVGATVIAAVAGQELAALRLPPVPIQLGGLDLVQAALAQQLRVEVPATSPKIGDHIQATLTGAGLDSTPDALAGTLGGDLPLPFKVSAVAWSLEQAGGGAVPVATDPEQMRTHTFDALLPDTTVPWWVRASLTVQVDGLRGTPVERQLELRSRPLRIPGVDLVRAAVVGKLRPTIKGNEEPGGWVEVGLDADFPLQPNGPNLRGVRLGVGRPMVAGHPVEILVRLQAGGSGLAGERPCLARSKDNLTWELLFAPEVAIRPAGPATRPVKVQFGVYMRHPQTGDVVTLHVEQSESIVLVPPIQLPALAAAVEEGKIACIAVPDYYRFWHVDGWESLADTLKAARKQVEGVLEALRAKGASTSDVEPYSVTAEALRLILDASGGAEAFRFMRRTGDIYSHPADEDIKAAQSWLLAVPQFGERMALVAFTRSTFGMTTHAQMGGDMAREVAMARGSPFDLLERLGELMKSRYFWDRFTRLPSAPPVLIRYDLQNPDGVWEDARAQFEAVYAEPQPPVPAVRLLPPRGYRAEWDFRMGGKKREGSADLASAGNPDFRMTKGGWDRRFIDQLNLSPPEPEA
jgi:hypothetical protein